MNHRNPGSSHTTLLILAFAAVYLIWGTTYLAMRIGVHSIPPFMMASARFLIAGSILYLVLRLRGLPHPTRSQWKSALIVGSLLFLGGNGLVTWAEQEIPSGVAALVIATMPMWMTLFDWLFFGGRKPSIKVAVGVTMGIAGIILLIGPAQLFQGTTELNLFYMLGLIFAPIFWSIGSLYCRQADLPQNVFMTNASQMLCGGGVLAGVSLFFGEPFGFRFSQVTSEAWLSILYLTMFGSMIALTAYAWLLKNASATKVATYSYVNPIIAVFLGWSILSEKITWQTGLAVMVIIAGVILIVTDKNKSKPADKIGLAKSELNTVSPTLHRDCKQPCDVEWDHRPVRSTQSQVTPIK